MRVPYSLIAAIGFEHRRSGYGSFFTGSFFIVPVLSAADRAVLSGTISIVGGANDAIISKGAPVSLRWRRVWTPPWTSFLILDSPAFLREKASSKNKNNLKSIKHKQSIRTWLVICVVWVIDVARVLHHSFLYSSSQQNLNDSHCGSVQIYLFCSPVKQNH